MTTTTAAIMRLQYCGSQTVKGAIESIVPAVITDKLFARSRSNKPLREWATNTSAAFRQFEWRRTGPATDPSVLDPAERLTIEQFTVTIAYPDLPRLYGDDPESIEDVVRSDARQVRDVLLDPGNLVEGCQAVIPTISAPERGDGVWFQDLVCEITYYESQVFTAAQSQ